MFVIGDWDAKVGSQEIPGVTGKLGLGVQNGSRSKANRVLPKNTLLIANTLFQQHKRRLYTQTLPDGQYRNQIDYILCSQGWRSSLQSAKTRPGADCDSDHELLIAKFRLKLKKVWKTTRPFMYKVKSEVTQSCLTLCNPMDYSLQGSSVHGIFQEKVLEWIAISFSRGSSQPRD